MGLLELCQFAIDNKLEIHGQSKYTLAGKKVWEIYFSKDGEYFQGCFSDDIEYAATEAVKRAKERLDSAERFQAFVLDFGFGVTTMDNNKARTGIQGKVQMANSTEQVHTNGGKAKAKTPETKAAAPEARPEISKEARRALFEAVDKQDEKVKAAETALEAAMDSRSAAVIKILDACGNGPFSYKGKELIGMRRTKKDGKVTAFFRGPGNTDAEEI